MRNTGNGDFVLEMALGDARLAVNALEHKESPHVGGAEHELAGIVGLPVRSGRAAGFTGNIGGHFVAKIPIFFEKRKIGQGLDNFGFLGKQFSQRLNNMLADMLPQLLFEKNALGLPLGINEISDGGILVHTDSGS